MGARTARRETWPLIGAFIAVVACFTCSTLYSQKQERDIGALSESLSADAMPSIEHLAAARTELRHVQALARSYVASGDDGSLDQMTTAQRAIDVDIDDYLRLRVYPGEAEIWRGIRETLDDVDAAIAALKVFAASGETERAKASVGPLVAACERAVGRVLEDVEFNARKGEQLGRRIGEERSRSRQVAIVLDSVSIALAALVALLAVRAVRRHTALLRDHNDLLARRSDELEHFAGRVAHDVKNPINAAVFGLALVQRASAGDARIGELAKRATSSLLRGTRILDGLLVFARSGARPAADARAEVRATVDGLLPDLRSTAEAAKVELHVEELADVAAQCAPGMLEVLVSNLVGNAIKYIGDGARRTVSLRARDLGASVRVEIEDTGVGIRAELREAIFEPFFRGTPSGADGIGLGLATVKKICDTHAGRVGVESAVGEGSLFWFELPKSNGASAGATVLPARAGSRAS